MQDLSDFKILTDALRDLSHNRLIDLDLPRGLHAFLHFLDVGAEILLTANTSSWSTT